jgi:outer membrane protein OmpA-like peptidoglycan-associated protein
LPASITVPAKPDREVTVEAYGHTSVKVSDGSDGKEVVIAGKHWTTELDTSKLAGDERQKWTALVDALQKSGWKIDLGKRDWNPPYASMKLAKAGKESWLFMWVGDQTQIEVVEKGDPTTKLALTPPTDGIAKLADRDDFPFLKKFPGAKLEKTEHDEAPLFVTLEAGKDPVMVASGTVIKSYQLPAHTSGLEEEVVYQTALKAAGWTIVEVNDAVTTGDPNLTAHYAKGPIDLWVHVHAGGTLQVADAGAERASTKLKADLDRACKVAIYGVNFDFDKATLRPDATPALDSIYKLLSDYKDLKVELGGHTDNVGDRRYNQTLSESRVAMVKTWLAKKGIAPDRLTTRGYADTQPIVSNDSPQNMARNRRVELKKIDCAK